MLGKCKTVHALLSLQITSLTFKLVHLFKNNHRRHALVTIKDRAAIFDNTRSFVDILIELHATEGRWKPKKITFVTENAQQYLRAHVKGHIFEL